MSAVTANSTNAYHLAVIALRHVITVMHNNALCTSLSRDEYEANMIDDQAIWTVQVIQLSQST